MVVTDTNEKMIIFLTTGFDEPHKPERSDRATLSSKNLFMICTASEACNSELKQHINYDNLQTLFRNSSVIYSLAVVGYDEWVEKNHAKNNAIDNLLMMQPKAGKKFSHDTQTEKFPRRIHSEVGLLNVVLVY